MESNGASRQVLTLYAYQTLIGNAVRMTPQLQNAWVQAELSDVRVSGGHCYMELLEKDDAGQTRAKARAMIWRSSFMEIRSKFYAATGRDISNGIKVLVRCSATYHTLYGLSISITDIDPQYTLGDMERLRREILDRLTREGVADRNRNLQPPALPRRIAVVSAAGAAGYGDFINQLDSNPDGFRIYHYLFPAVMQGERTTPSVLAALNLVESTIDLWDCVVIIRGGGATTDLNGFDNIDLARRVATFPLPVIVGIGHERDRTVLDELACVRCKTPTAVAAYIIDSFRTAYTAVADRVRRIAKYGGDALRGEHLRLSAISQNIPAIAKARILRERMALSQRTSLIERNISARFNAEENRLSQISLRVGAASKAILTKAGMKLNNYESLIRVLSPDNTLKRGFSITRVDGKAITDASAIKPGTRITTTLLKGELKSVTEE